MQRIPSPFDPRRHALQAAAGGGTTSCSCSCCVATLVASVAIPHAVFKNALAPGKVIPDAEVQALSAKGGAASTQPPLPVPQSDLSGVQVEHPAEAMAAGLVSSASTIVGLPSGRAWMYAWMSLGVGLLALLIAVVLSSALAPLWPVFAVTGLAAVLWVYARAYREAGRLPGKGVLAGVGVLVLLALVLCVELFAWLFIILS